jgi:cell division GTPase FtsZ
MTKAVRTAATDLLTHVTLIGIGFADDVRMVLHRGGQGGGGCAHFGTGEAEGPTDGDRAVRAAEAAPADFRQRLRSP